MNKKSQEISPLAEYSLGMSKPPSLILSLSDPDSAPLATEPTSASAVSIQSISTCQEQSLSKQKAASQELTERSLRASEHSTPKSVFAYSSKPTTGQQRSSDSATPNGPLSTPCGGMSGSTYRTVGLPTDSAARKNIPLWSGLVKYFPDALVAVAAVSKQGSDQHHPGKPMHWDRNKSMDQEDTLLRHLWESGTLDTDGHRHSAKVAWRALAMLQLEIEKANKS